MLDRVLDDTYRLLEEIGKGGFGAVYKGVRKDYEGMGPVAIKVLNKHSSMKAKDYARFQREASLMSQLVHPGIVSIYELVQTESCYYIVMELITGSNLKDFVAQRGGFLSLLEILEVLIQSADALEYVHGHRIEHRDIKPQNILVCEKGSSRDAKFQIKLVDFGVARLSPYALGGETSKKSEVVGTYAYMSPEATGLLELPIDHRSDIYSLGVVAFELIAGRLPFVRPTASEIARAHASEVPPSMTEVLGKEVSPVLENIVARCIAKNPSDRYQSIFGLSCDLKRVRSELRNLGRISNFQLAGKDLDLMRRFYSIFIGREKTISDVSSILGVEKKKSRLTWILLRGAVGTGKSRCLDEIRHQLEKNDIRYLYLKFSESEKGLPYQALSMAVNDYLTQTERSRMTEFRQLLDELVRKSGNIGARQLSGLIPALRPFHEEKHWAGKVDDSAQLSKISSSPSTVLNQAFKELFDSMVGGEENRLVFLLDDIHLGDSSTIALLTYLIEGMNTGVNFSVVLTIRDNLSHLPQMVQGLLDKAARLKRRFHEIQINNFDDALVNEFFERLGIRNLSADFVKYAMRKTDSSPLQLQLFVKQLVSHNALVPVHKNNSVPLFDIDWVLLKDVKVELFNVETLVASLGSLESRDRKILTIAAICQEPTLFELFKLDSDFSSAELETRLHALTKRGILEEIWDDALPVHRRSYALTHEKLRTALLVNIDPQEIRQIHFLLVKRIQMLFRNPQRSQILLTAKHIDGAGALFEPSDATIGFLKAARICIAESEHNLARYYIEKAHFRLQSMAEGSAKIQLLREIQEARYMIFAAQGNLVAASEVCKGLIELTAHREKKQKLQIYWAQLQLSLGRHNLAFQQCKQIFDEVTPSLTHYFKDSLLKLEEKSRHAPFRFLLGFLMRAALPLFETARLFESMASRYLSYSLNQKGVNIFEKALRWFSGHLPFERKEGAAHQALALMLLSQFHGHEAPLGGSVYHVLRLNVAKMRPERFVCLIWILNAALAVRKGNVKDGYRTLDRVERYFIEAGFSESSRWLTSLKALWFDYPNGRMDRLFQVFADGKGTTYPTSGLLHFETYGLRAWLRLIAPSAFPSRDLDIGLDRRKSSARSSEKSSNEVVHGNSRTSFQMDNLLENNNARRVLDSGENGQFTALALFSDAFRYALSDRVDSLKRSYEQMQRQRSYSFLGEAFQMFGAALLAQVSGRHSEALKFYKKACRRILRSNAEIIALPVSDALRFAVLFFPVWATSQGNRKLWLWGSSLDPWLEQVDKKLLKMEARIHSENNAMTFLFSAMKLYSKGQTSSALRDLDAAIREARIQKMELLECLSLSILAVFSAERKISRAKEHMLSVSTLAKQFKWKLVERFVVSTSRLHEIDLVSELLPEDKSLTLTSRGGTTQLAINHLIRNLQSLLESRDRDTLLKESTRIAMQALSVSSGFFFLKNFLTSRFDCCVEIKHEKAEMGLGATQVSSDEIKKWLPNSLDEYVKLVMLEDSDLSARRDHSPSTGETAEQKENKNDVAREFDEEDVTQKVAFGANKGQQSEDSDLDQTVVVDLPEKQFSQTQMGDTASGHYANEEVHRKRRSSSLLILISVTNQGELLGWIALPDVKDHLSNAKEMEQELMILGMHVGFLVGKFMELKEAADGAMPIAKLKTNSREQLAMIQEHLPEHVRVEVYSGDESISHAGWRAYGIRSQLLIACAWKMDAAREKTARKLCDLVDRHLQLFVYSLRLQPEKAQVMHVADKLVSDFTALFETLGHNQSGLESVDLNFLVFDMEERHCYEGVFGAEMFTFTGESQVDREGLHELQGVIGAEQVLIFRERFRSIKGHCGWAFGIDNQSRVALFRFADVDFLQKYLPHILGRQPLLPETLGVQSRGAGTEMFAIFSLDEEQVTLREAPSIVNQ